MVALRKWTKYTLTIFALLLCLAGCLGLASPSLAAGRGIAVTTKAGQPVKLYQDYAALVIGVSDYKYWPKLPGAIRDAKEVAAALKKMGFAVKLVQNPGSDALAGLLKRLPYNQGKPEDRALLIYFAGHGATESLADGSRMGYIVPGDCPLPTTDPAGFAELAISMQSFESLARRIRCRHVLMAFDSCFSGSLFALSRAAPRDISEKIARPVRQFVTAGNENEEVPDKSTFKQVFIDGIGGEADYDRDGYVTGSELGMYLQKQVVNYTRGAQHPQYGKIRNPKLDKGDFVFLLAGGPGATPGVKPPPPPPAPPRAPGTDDLADLKEEARKKAAWDAWQKRMQAYWREVESLDGSSLSAAKKARAWRGALDKFKDDNPFGTEDESLRRHARERLRHWEKPAAPVPEPEPAGLKPGVLFIRGWGKDLSDGSGVCFHGDYPNLRMSDDPKRCKSKKDRRANAAWRGSYEIRGGNLLLLNITDLTAPDPPRNRIAIGYTVRLKNATFRDGSTQKDFRMLAFSRKPKKSFARRAVTIIPRQPDAGPEKPRPKPVPVAAWSKDKRFSKDADGVITDSRNGLQWYVGPDKGTNWYDAKKWVEGLTVAGGGWRMPSLRELKGISQKGARISGPKYLSTIFKTSGAGAWSGEKSGSSDAWYFLFKRGTEYGCSRNDDLAGRAFAVRSAPQKAPAPEPKPVPVSAWSKDKRFSKDADGVITDHKTRLRWCVGPDRHTNWDDAKKWVDGLTVAGGGWRMPRKGELLSLSQKNSRAKGAVYLPGIFRTSGYDVWAGDSSSPTNAWSFEFRFGRGIYVARKGYRFNRAFAVNDLLAEKMIRERFIKKANGVIKDRRTGLEWKLGPAGKMTRPEAEKWARSLSAGGGGWRLPGMKELDNLAQWAASGRKPSHIPDLFRLGANCVWSSDKSPNDGAFGRVYDFNLPPGHPVRDHERPHQSVNYPVMAVREPGRARNKPSGAGKPFKRFTNSIGQEFVLIPAGSFMMGNAKGWKDERPIHRVTISRPFYLQTTEVTQSQWKALMGKNPSDFIGDDQPVARVRWTGAKEFIRKLNKKEGTNKYRLPTEAEWEYAARAGSDTDYCFGDDPKDLHDYAWYSKNSGKKTHPVKGKKPNCWGIYDMHGNLAEFVQDRFEKYSGKSQTDPKGPSSGKTRSVRGGSYSSPSQGVRSAVRQGVGQHAAGMWIGFRLAKDADK